LQTLAPKCGTQKLICLRVHTCLAAGEHLHLARGGVVAWGGWVRSCSARARATRMHHLNTLPSRSVMGSFALGQHLFAKFTPLCCPAILSTRCVGHAVWDVAVQFVRLAVQCSGGGQIAAQPVTRHHRSSFTAFLPGRAPLRFQACCAEPWCCKGLLPLQPLPA
jgi:hypothetical protein